MRRTSSTVRAGGTRALGRDGRRPGLAAAVVARAVLAAAVAATLLAVPRGGRAAEERAGGDAMRSRGAALYRARCASCHGPAGYGNGPDARLFDPPARDLRTGFLGRFSTDDLVRRVREGTPLQIALDPAALRARASEVEAIATHLKRLPDVNWRLAERGQELYVDRCEPCHGPYGRPEAAAPPGVPWPRDLSDPTVQRTMSDEALLAAVRHGRAGMPAIVPRIDERDGRALAAFVRLLSPGFEQYTRYCAACHGDDGRGDGGLDALSYRPPVVFDRAYFVRRNPEEVRQAVWHMVQREKPAMPHLRTRLGEHDARAVIEYLKSLD